MEKKFEFKLYSGILLMVSAIALVLTAAFFSLHALTVEQRDLIDVHVQERILAGQTRFEMKNQLSLLPAYFSTGDKDLRRALAESHERFQGTSRALVVLSHDQQTQDIVRIVRESEARIYALTRVSLQEYLRAQEGFLKEDLWAAPDRMVAIKIEELEQAKRTMRRMSGRVVVGLIATSALAALLAFVAAVLSMRVVRARELLLDQERRMSQARKDAVEVVAHDLRGPLASVSMTLGLLEEELHGEGQSLKLFGIVTRSVDAMRRLIDNLLDHAKIESGRVQLSLEDCDLRLLIAEIAERFAPLALKKSLRMETTFSREDITLRCDRNRLDQALSNLIGNAIKFTPEGGVIAVHADFDGKEATVHVRDNGPGIAADQLSHVFERYWQVRSAAQQGTGLGLAIVKGIAEAHGGHVEVKSRPNEGADFSLHLPTSL